MSTFLRPHFTLSRILIAAIWVVVSVADLSGPRVSMGNIQNTLQKHEAIRNLRRDNQRLPLVL